MIISTGIRICYKARKGQSHGTESSQEIESRIKDGYLSLGLL